jgi:hypothetical protein
LILAAPWEMIARYPSQKGDMRAPRGLGSAARIITIATVVAALICLSAGIASAHDEAPPRTLVKTRYGGQPGSLYASFWAKRDGQYCTGISQDGPATFTPTGPRFRPGEVARVIMLKTERPSHLDLWYWRRIDREGHPIGEQTELRYRLRAVKIRHRTVWEARFVPPSIENVYLSLLGYWWDQEECHILQDAAYTYTISSST